MRLTIGSLLFVVFAHASFARADTAPAQPPADGASVGVDVRLVLDVSGSMKSGDPEYLRQDVLNDLIEALPPGSRGGIWTFGGYATNVVPYGPIDDAWRRAARAARARIVSNAPLTNLRDALAAAAWDADRPAPEWDRHVLLVTDGRVDVGRDDAQNDAQRHSIVDEWLPRLRAAGIRVDSIALSPDADLPFLARLGAGTDGRSGRADTVAAVKDFVTRTYASATPRMGSFDIAADVTEVTVFAPRAKAFSLVAPNGQTIDAAGADEDVRWTAAGGGSAVTLTTPAPGRWRYTPDGPVDVYPDLALAVTPNKSTEAPALRVALVDGERPVDPELRDAVALEATLMTLYGSETLVVTAAKDAAAFDVALGSPLTPDDEVALRLVGPTFARSRSYAEVIAHPIDVDLRAVGDGNVAASVHVNLATVDRKTLRVLATTAIADGGRASLGVGERQTDGAWTVAIPALGANVEAKIKVLFNDVGGTDTQIELDPIAVAMPISKQRRFGFDEHGRRVVDPVRPPPVIEPIVAESLPTETPAPTASVVAETPVTQPPGEHAEAEPVHGSMQIWWEWIAAAVVALASVASLAWIFLRKRVAEPDGAFDAALASYRDTLASVGSKPPAATTT